MSGVDPQREPEGVPVTPSLELDPLEVHIARLRAELLRTQLVLGIAAAAGALAALACLWAAKNVGAPQP